jgi:type III restriction enzyme
MITLKDYQSRVLESLGDFFRIAAREQNPEPAFREITERTFGTATPYIPVSVAGMKPQMPYVCLRVPTGGGKTLLACHAAGLAMTDFMQAERAVVLWLVPSNTILDQTADALRDPRHPYRRALELACGSVEVVTIEEALRLPRAAVTAKRWLSFPPFRLSASKILPGEKCMTRTETFRNICSMSLPTGLRTCYPARMENQNRRW